MARPRINTEKDIQDKKHALYEKRKNDKVAKKKDDAKREEYAKTVKQIKLTLPNKQAEELKKYCDQQGTKAQDLIRKLLVDAGAISMIEETE